MISISARAKQMPSSPIRKLVPFAEEAKSRGVKVYHLNIGQPDIHSPELFLNAYRRHELSVLEYSHSAGQWAYREGLARYYQKNGIRVEKEEILVTTGGSEAIIFAMLATMDPGDEVIIPEPFYTNYNGFARIAGVEIVPVTCKLDDGFKLPPISQIEAKISPKTRAILICNPNNPTGYVYSLEEWRQVRDLVKKHDLYVLSDEVYREFVYDGAKHYSVFDLDGIDDRALLLDSVSKRYSACGARVGCLVSRNREILEAALKFGQARLSSPTLDQMAAQAALETPQSYFDEVISKYRRRRDVVYDSLAKIPGVVGSKPQGAFYAMVRLPVDDAEKFCIWMLREFSDRNETIMLAPASGFYATPGLGVDEVRIAFVLNTEAMARSIELLGIALEKYPGRK